MDEKERLIPADQEQETIDPKEGATTEEKEDYLPMDGELPDALQSAKTEGNNHSSQVEKVQEEDEAPVGEGSINEDGDQEAEALNMESALPRLEEGSILNGRVVLVQEDQAYVDVGWKSDLPVPLSELTADKVSSAKEVVTEGDNIQVMVLRSDDDEKILLSKRRADEEEVWENLEKTFTEKQTVNGVITAAIKGGLDVKIDGVRAFLPASHADLGYVADLNTLVGKECAFYIIELSVQRKRMVVSRKAVLEEEKAQAEEKVFSELQEGEKRHGRITRLTTFGAFVEIGHGVEGLLHISEISWDRLQHPSERLKEGEEIEVLVIRVDHEAKRISLSLKQLSPHPWKTVEGKFREGELVEGEVVRLTPFGAFVHLAEGIDGLIHISQLSETRVEKPEDVVRVGQKVKVKILKVDPAEKRIGLSLKEAQKKEVVPGNPLVSAEDDKPLSSNLGAILAEKMSNGNNS